MKVLLFAALSALSLTSFAEDSITNRIANLERAFDRMNSTYGGRRLIHGVEVKTSVTNDIIRIEYKDGFVYTNNVYLESGRLSSEAMRIHALVSHGLAKDENEPIEIRAYRFRHRHDKAKLVSLTD